MPVREKIGVILHDHKSGMIDTDLAADAILAIPEIRDALGKCCDGGPQWGHAWNCPKCPD